MTLGERPGLDGRARVILPILLIMLVGLTVHRLGLTEASPAPAPASQDESIVVLSGKTMGTTYTIKLVSPPLTLDKGEEVGATIQSVLERINKATSTYREDSDLTALSRHRTGELFRLSPDLRQVLTIADLVNRKSGGALDVTLAPLVNLWGFGPHGRPGQAPSEERLARMLKVVGHDKFTLGNHTVKKHRPEVSFDLSAVAKGYAVDILADELSSLGFPSLLVEVGGELKALGTRQGGRPWRVAVERPDEVQRAVHQVVELTDMGMATSGDYRNFYKAGERRLSHLIDPRTGRPVEHELASVTVVHRLTAEADAWATALSVLGPEKGPQVAAANELAALFLVRDGKSGFRSMESPRFALLGSKP